MTLVDHKWSALPVPHAVTMPDRVPKERYFDPEFYELEAALLWPRVWQMACRLEEIPGPSDFVEYEILDQSVVVVRTGDTEAEVQAFQNACRHRGVKLVEGRGTLKSGFTCPFHGWCYGVDGQNTFVSQRRTFSEHNLEPAELDLVPVRTEVWGGCVWINFDADAPPLRTYLEPIAGILDAWKVASLRTEWWYACRIPANWKLVQEAFVEQYHVLETHPQLRIPGRFPPRKGQPFDPKVFVEGEIQYLRTMCDGMAGMVHADDVRIAEGMRDIELPDEYGAAVSAWNQRPERRRHRLAPPGRPRHPRPQRPRRAEHQRADGLLLPPLHRPADVQQRLRLPVPPAGARGDADGALVADPHTQGRGHPGRPLPRSGPTTTSGGRRSRPRTSPTWSASSVACTPRGSATCASRSRPRGTSRTTSA